MSSITPWMCLLQSIFPDHTRLFKLGTSYEGRDLLALRISTRPNVDNIPQGRSLKTIVIIGGSHAREWVSVSTVNYPSYSLITSFGKISAITKLLEDMDLVIIPSLNSDGYIYT